MHILFAYSFFNGPRVGVWLRSGAKATVLKLAALAAAMDPTVDPCEDFYEFACGGWGQKNIAPPDRATVSEEIQVSFRQTY